MINTERGEIMNYTKMLNMLISKSGMSQKEISDKCKELGEEVTTTYLSALKNTNGKIASDSISRTIAKACNAKYEEILVVQAYIDRAPLFIVEFLEEIRTMYTQSLNIASKAYKDSTLEYKIYEETERINSAVCLAEFICMNKGKLAASPSNYETSMNMLDNSINQNKEKAADESENYLLIPLRDMNDIKIISKNDVNRIKEMLDKNI